MNSYKVKLLGVTVAELVSTEPEVVVRIDNTGGSFELAVEDDSPEDDEYSEEYKFGFGAGTCLA